MNEIEMKGCTPEPLMNYLKAIGVLRILAEQKDSDVRGWWKANHFTLSTELNEEELLQFFLLEYRPTPIVSPWNGGSGFFKEDNQEALEKIKNSKNPRLSIYSRVIQQVQQILREENLKTKPEGEEKAKLIHRCRCELPDEVVRWIDSAIVIQEEKPRFAPILGTGGNDGRLEFSNNFMGRIIAAGLHQQRLEAPSESWLKNSLFGRPVILNKAAVGQFSPGRAGGPNMTQGVEADFLDNPWDFILMMEGTLFLAGAASKKFGRVNSAQSAFPFTVSLAAVGYGSASDKDETRGEIWLPIWQRKASLEEIRKMFSEARIEVSGRPAENGVDFARAVASLGIDRGVSEFYRFGFLKRNGKSYLANLMGKFVVSAKNEVDLLREIDGWLESFRWAAGKKQAPAAFNRALWSIEKTIMDFCKYGGRRYFQEILIALGEAERIVARSIKFLKNQEKDGKIKIKPIFKLSTGWIEAADDDSKEFLIARALTSIFDPEKKLGALRQNIEPVDTDGKWREENQEIVWNAADLSMNLIHVIRRRIIDAECKGAQVSPLTAKFSVSLEEISSFLWEETDDHRLEKLIWGLTLVDSKCGSKPANNTDRLIPVPRAYTLFKLLFWPYPIEFEMTSQGGYRLKVIEDVESRPSKKKMIEHSVLSLLESGRTSEAAALAAKRLRSIGFPPSLWPLQGNPRDDVWRESSYKNGSRLAAALLIPLAFRDFEKLVNALFVKENEKETLSVN